MTNQEDSIASQRLKSFVERIENLEQEKKALGQDINDIYSEAKGTGFDVKALKQVIKLRSMTPDERKEAEMIIDTYLTALGME